MEESAQIIASYEDGVCPDCGEAIPINVVDGSECDNCEHVFYLPRPCDDGELPETASSITFLNDTPGPGKVRIVANGSKGKITITVEVDEDGYPNIDCHFDGRRGRCLSVDTNGDTDPSRAIELQSGEQLFVTFGE